MNKLLIKYLFVSKTYYFIYIIFCGFGLFIAFYPTFLSGFSFIQNDPGDTRLVNYFLEHSFQLLTNRNYVGDLWSPAFFYPYEKVLTFSENLFGSAPVYWVFRTLFSAELAFQFWMIAVSILNFFSFAFLMRRYQASHLLSAFGAFLFAFGMPRIAKIGHQQLLPQFFTPFVFLSVWEFVKQPTRKRLTLFLLLTYLQVLAGIYLGWFLLFSLLIFFAVTYGLDSELRTRLIAYLRGNYRATIAITLSWLVLMLLTLSPYLEAKSIFGARPYLEVDGMLPRISSWFAVAPGSLLFPVLGWTSTDLLMAHEHYMFAGFIVLLLTGISIYTLFFYRKALNSERVWLVRVCLLVFICIFCLSLRLPSGFSLWRIVYEVVPGASVIRGVTRIWTIAYLYLLIAVILSFDSLVNSLVASKRSRILLVTILCVIGASEQIIFELPSYEKAPYIKQKTEVSNLIKKDCDIAYLSLNPELPFYAEQLSAMWAGIQANVPVVNGYSGNVPPNYGDSSKSLKAIQVINWLEPVSQDEPKRLCMIVPSVLDQPDSFVSNYSVQKNSSLSGNFTSHVIQLPIPKVFSQDIKVFSQDVNFFEFPKRVEPSSAITVPVLVKNTSNFVWSAKGENPTNFSYRWIDSTGNVAIFDGDGDRTELPLNLVPGDVAALTAVIRTPSIPGRYKLILTMVQENVVWFNGITANYPELPIDVISR